MSGKHYMDADEFVNEPSDEKKQKPSPLQLYDKIVIIEHPFGYRLPTASVTKITGAAELHEVLMRVALADNPFEMLDFKSGDSFSRMEVTRRFDELAKVVHPSGVMDAFVNKEHYDSVMPFAKEALPLLQGAKHVLFDTLDEMFHLILQHEALGLLQITPV